MTKLRNGILLCSLFLLSSCFEIVEQIFVKKDGSGNYEIVLNLSKSKTKINSIRQMKVVNGHDVPSEYEVKNKLKTIEKSMAKTAGISAVKTTLDLDNYIATISCNFAKVNQLNNVVKNIANDNNGAGKYNDKNYSFDIATNVFERINKISLKKDYNKMSNADKEVFATANYTAIYKFENPIVSATNKDAKISPSKKAIMLQQNALDIITEKKSLENKITLTK
jgi:hypothetical protein